MTLTAREKNAYALVLTLTLLGFVLALDPILPGGSYVIWDGRVQVGVNGYWVNGVGINEKVNYKPPAGWPTPLIPLPTLLLVLTCILPILLAFLLFSYLFLAFFANLGDWKTVIFDSPPLIKLYAALVWAMTIVMLALDAATVDKGYKNEEMRLTDLGWATLITGFILTSIWAFLIYRERSSSSSLLPCFGTTPTKASKSSKSYRPEERSKSSSGKSKSPSWMDRLVGK